MAARFGYAFALAALLAGSPAAMAQVIVQDNFDSYADTAAFLNQWKPASGLGTVAIDPSDPNYTAGILTSDPLTSPTNFPGIQGVAVDHIGAAVSTNQVNQWGGAFDPVTGGTPAFTAVPSATQNVRLSADIFVGTSGNERMSVGLRATLPDGSDADALADTSNLFEMGLWNAAPTVLGIEGTAQVSTGYGFRIINFGPVSAPLTGQPNWQFFQLPQGLDRTTDTDEIVSIGDVGAGWHTYTATFGLTEVTVTIDLFRDGFVNTRDENGVIVIGSGTAGVDATLTLPVATLPAGFNNLRMGGPSGVSSPGGGFVGFDNILLEMQNIAVPADNADFNGDNIVDGADFLIWQAGFGVGTTLATGDADGNGAVNDLDLGIWKTQFGTDPTPAVGAVPEPTTLALAGLAMVAAGLAARRR